MASGGGFAKVNNNPEVHLSDLHRNRWLLRRSIAILQLKLSKTPITLQTALRTFNNTGATWETKKDKWWRLNNHHRSLVITF